LVAARQSINCHFFQEPAMSQFDHQEPSMEPSRRQFLQTASALAVGGAVLGTNARVAASAHPGGSDEIKVALIGCGGRGSGAITQALATKGPVTLWAMADAFGDRVQLCLDQANQQVERGRRDGDSLFKDSKIDVPKERQFVGFDAYKHALDSGADLVILATPPGFRPIHFEAAVDAGKNIFMEKPVAVDAPGVRRVLAANAKAKEKDLMVAVGLQRRHDPRYLDVMKRLQDGAIGDILYTRVYWNGGGLWVKPREANQTEMEYQMRNWYYFNWLCGDHIVEQHIHNLDVGNWLRGMHPVEAQGMGGRQVRTGKEYGQIFDHHCVEYTYSDGTKMFSQCRHIGGCATEVNEHAHGPKGTSDIGDARIKNGEGDWRSKEPKLDAWHQEHHDMFAALRRGENYNEGDYGAESTMTAIMGRMATYSGDIVKWDAALASKADLSPADYDFAATPPVVPDANGFYPVPVPGKTNALKA
jgi:myo-inositol 2-dehydrogenase / D-chiro-inositol 1-dehydrogenase